MHAVSPPCAGVPGAAPSRVEVAQEVKLRLVDAPQPARLMDVDKNTNKRRNPMSEEKQKYVVTPTKKHGRDFAKMARDRKRNPQPVTSTNLRKLEEIKEMRMKILQIPKSKTKLFGTFLKIDPKIRKTSKLQKTQKSR